MLLLLASVVDPIATCARAVASCLGERDPLVLSLAAGPFLGVAFTALLFTSVAGVFLVRAWRTRSPEMAGWSAIVLVFALVAAWGVRLDLRDLGDRAARLRRLGQASSTQVVVTPAAPPAALVAPAAAPTVPLDGAGAATAPPAAH